MASSRTARNCMRATLGAAGLLFTISIGGYGRANPPPARTPPLAPDTSATAPPMSAARIQELELEAARPIEPVDVELFDAKAASPAEASDGTAASPRSSTPALAPGFINFGYIQSESILTGLRWNALTHVGTLFVDFLADATLQNPSAFTGRSSILKAGGAAQAAGTKVILVVRNDNFDETILDAVMQSPTLRTTLINNIVNLVTADTYCGGVSFDFEFSWGAATRDGISAFMQAMRAALPAQYEVSVYTHAIYSTTYWNIAAIAPYINYMLYSTYDWGTGNTAHAIADYNNCVPYWHDYLAAGLPPEKLVLVWASYSRRWTGINAYNAVGSSPVSQGFTDGLYDTTLRTSFAGPWASNYVTGDEVEWYTYNDGTDNITATWDSQRTLELKIRAALSCPPTALPSTTAAGWEGWDGGA